MVFQEWVVLNAPSVIGLLRTKSPEFGISGFRDPGPTNRLTSQLPWRVPKHLPRFPNRMATSEGCVQASIQETMTLDHLNLWHWDRRFKKVTAWMIPFWYVVFFFEDMVGKCLCFFLKVVCYINRYTIIWYATSISNVRHCYTYHLKRSHGIVDCWSQLVQHSLHPQYQRLSSSDSS